MERTESEVVREFGAAIRSAADPAPDRIEAARSLEFAAAEDGEWTDRRVAQFAYEALQAHDEYLGQAPALDWDTIPETIREFLALVARLYREGK